MSVIKINGENFESIRSGDKPVLIDFYADWCGPCMRVSPIIDAIGEERDDIVVGKVNVDHSPELAAKFGISSIPALFVIKDGKIKDSAIGYKPKEVLLEMLK